MDGFARSAVVRLLSDTVGEERAATDVDRAAARLGLPPGGPWPRSDALAVLEAIAETPGIVGITARFAKSRLHLAPASEPPHPRAGRSPDLERTGEIEAGEPGRLDRAAS